MIIVGFEIGYVIYIHLKWEKINVESQFWKQADTCLGLHANTKMSWLSLNKLQAAHNGDKTFDPSDRTSFSQNFIGQHMISQIFINSVKVYLNSNLKNKFMLIVFYILQNDLILWSDLWGFLLRFDTFDVWYYLHGTCE